MHVTLLNLTTEDILCSWNQHQSILVSPSHPESTSLPKHCRHISLHNSKESDLSVNPASPLMRISLALSASWQAVKVPDDCPWRIFLTRNARSDYKLTIFPKRNLASFLSEMPDSVPLHSLLLPGTHDTMAFYGWPISQCQSLSTPLDVQLQSGIRILDIRLAVVKGRLIAYHGVYPEKTPFQTILSTIHAFLNSPSSNRETIVMSLKQEDFADTPPPIFSQAVHEEMSAGVGGLDMFFLENRIPTLGEVRGKVVMFSRFGGDGSGWENGLEGLGIHPTTWPDSEKDGFTWECKNTHVRTHDWYGIPSFLYIPEKVALATQLLLPPGKDDLRPTLSITYFSAASFPFAAPPTVAQGFGWPKVGLGVEGVNSRVGKWILDMLNGSAFAPTGNGNEKRGSSSDEPRLRGWAYLDFYDNPEHALVELLVECNFRGRRAGEEGW